MISSDSEDGTPETQYSSSPASSSDDAQYSDTTSSPISVIGSEIGRRVQICQYVHRVVDFSSQYGSDTSISYTAFNIIGRQTKYPDCGDFPETFAMRTYGRWWETAPSAPVEFMSQNMPKIPIHDFIVVEFEEYVIPCSVTVFETYNPGALVGIWAYAKHVDKWCLLWEGPPVHMERCSRKFTPPIKQIPYLTRIIRLEFNHSSSEYFTEIDAVLLKGYGMWNFGLKPVSIKKNPHIKKGQLSEKLESFQILIGHNENHKQILRDFLENDLNMFIRQTGNLVPEDEPEITLKDLPCEILLNIFSYLDMKSLFRVTQVCKKLYDIGTDPYLYRDLNLKPYWHVVNDDMLVALSKRSRLLRKLDLSWCGLFHAITPAVFKEFIRICGKGLLDLRLNSCQFLNVNCMEVVAATCKELKELSLRNYTNVLNYHCVKNYQSLERLDLFRTNIKSDLLMMVLKNNPDMKHLNLGISSLSINMDEVAVQISQCNPGIVSLDFWKSHALSSVGLNALSRCGQLEEIDFGWCLRTEAFPGEGLKCLLRGCPKLKKLFLAAIRGLNDRDLVSIAEFCPRLEQLDLMGVLGISREGYFHILKRCKSLKLLDLSFCEPIDDIQIAIWRDAFGVDIKGNFNASTNNLF